MAGEEKVLSQAEIDALVMAMETQRESIPDIPSPPRAKPDPPPFSPPSPKLEENKNTAISGITNEQTLKIEECLKKLELLDQKIGIIWKVLGLPADSSQPFKSEIDTIKKYIHELAQRASTESGCNMLRNFQCDNCNSVNLVAIKTKCTKCGKENWLGWWPSQ